MTDSVSDNKKVCNRCGDCCRYIAVPVQGQMSKEDKDWLRTRGCRIERGKGDLVWLVIPSVCPHLVDINPDTGEDLAWAYCDIYDDRPDNCKHYPNEFDWKPRGCTL